MSHISEVVSESRGAIDRFIESAEWYCGTIEDWRADPQGWSPKQFLGELDRGLPLLYASATGLPTHDQLDIDADDGYAPDYDPWPGTSYESNRDFSPKGVRASLEASRLADLERFPTLAGLDHDRLGLMKALGAFFGSLDLYVSVFDPREGVNPSGREPSDDAVPYHRVVGDDLAEVYWWLKPPLRIWQMGGDEAQYVALWRWRFGLEFVAGMNLVDVMRPIYWITHRDADDEELD